MSGSARPATVIAVVGPTAVGKTAVAEGIALARDGEIISADSMQVYRGMDVGTSKPVRPRRVPYHCIDLVDPGEPYSAARFQSDARAAVADILGRGRLPILAGGTGLYVRAALDDWEIPGGHTQTILRHDLERDAETHGSREMHRRLAEKDPASADLIHPNNVRRVLRALEMAESGDSYAENAARFSERHSVYDARLIGLTMDRDVLYQRIERRVDDMLEAGLLAEVRTLLDHGLRDAITASQAIGYKELVPIVEGESDLEAATAAIKRATRRYAKRQMTWFRADPRIRWIDVTGTRESEVVERSVELISSS